MNDKPIAPHVIFRNQVAFCSHCGQSGSKIELPISIEDYTKAVDKFCELHKDCKKTWTEPVNENPEQHSEIYNALWWREHGARGNSSVAMYNVLFVTIPGCENHPLLPTNNSGAYPHDPDDFGRCYALLKAVPQWRKKLKHLKPLGPVWERYVLYWEILTLMYELDQKDDWKNYEITGMHSLMERIINTDLK